MYGAAGIWSSSWSAASTPCSVRTSAGATWAQSILSADTYNQVFTMHGVVMIFLAAHSPGCGVRQLPRAATDRRQRRRFPSAERLQLLGLPWRRPFPGLFDVHWRLVGECPRRGLVRLLPPTAASCSRRPRASTFFAIGHADDRYRLACWCAINLIVTALNMRTPGMTLMKMPVLTWMILIVQFLLLVRHPGHFGGPVPVDLRPPVRRPTSSASVRGGRPAPCGSTYSGYLVTLRSTY